MSGVATADPAWRRARDLLGAGGAALVACHVNPDADALGSALAVGIALRRRGRRVVVSFGTDEPTWAVPESLAFLPSEGLAAPPCEALAFEAELVVTTDTGSADRLGPLQPALACAGEVVVVDHHLTNTRFGSVNVVDPAAASSTAVVARLLDGLVDLDPALATCLYAGLVADTGSFRFEATTPGVHRLAGQLLEAGADPVAVGRAMFDTARFAAVRLLGAAIGRALLDPPVVWTWVSAAERAEVGVTLGEVDAVIDVLRSSREADVAVVCKEVVPGRWSVSLRSRGATDVSRVAADLGGGGHRLAAGFTAHAGSADEIVAALRERLA